jgi:multidrug efflux pump subunit AcrA (membrane-fusion protein)
MYADVSLPIQRSGDALVVPIQAVDQTGAQPFVMMVDSSNRVQRRQVQVGVATANRIEILSGLQQGDKIIVANLGTFQSNEAVTPKLSSMVDADANGEAQ